MYGILLSYVFRYMNCDFPFPSFQQADNMCSFDCACKLRCDLVTVIFKGCVFYEWGLIFNCAHIFLISQMASVDHIFLTL